MAVSRVRHGRQIRLREIGEAGQARLDAAVVPLGGTGFARELEATYLRRAGPQPVDGEARPVDVDALGLEHPAARDVGEGALRALLAIRGVLGLGEG